MKSNLHIRKLLGAILKAAIFIGTVIYIYENVWNSEEPVRFGNYLRSLRFNEVSIIVVVFLLMFVNWAIEAMKWSILARTIEYISFSNAFKAIMSGVTINNWIPNRMGEFIGRIVFISPANRTKAAFATVTGGLAQMFATLFFGISALLWWFHFSSFILLLIAVSSLIIFSLLLFIYFNLPVFAKYISDKRFLHKISKHLEGVMAFQKIDLLKVLILAIMRYLVYTFQYYLLLLAFGTEVGYSTALIGIPLIFAIQAFIPSVAITEIGIRGAVILAVFQSYTTNQTGLLLAAWSIWIINIIVPSIIGAFFLLLHKRKMEVL